MVGRNRVGVGLVAAMIVGLAGGLTSGHAAAAAAPTEHNNGAEAEAEVEAEIEVEAGAMTLYLSSDSSGRADGIRFGDEDIMAWNSATGAWSLAFDGSAAGLPGAADISGFAFADRSAPEAGDLLLTFDRPISIPGLGRVDDSDIVRFDRSAGTFPELLFDGSSHGLTTGAEDIDALDTLDGDLIVSTVGTARVPGPGGAVLVARDEDLLRFDAAAGRFSIVFDGSDVDLGGEDLTGAALDGDALYSAYRGRFVVPGLRGDKDDVPRFDGVFGQTTSGSLTPFFDGDVHGFRNEQIDGLAIGPADGGGGPGPGDDDFLACNHPTGGSIDSVDFRALNQAGFDAQQLNVGANPTFLRAVFELPSDRMRFGEDGLELGFDVGIPGPLNFEYRAELREKVIDQSIPAGSTQMYCMRFRVDELPPLYGPVEIFQRFDRAVDGPDIGIELTGANQFSNAVPNDIQVVAWDGRHRTGSQLVEINTLMVVVHNHPTDGAYKVMLNDSLLRERSGIDTTGSPGGSWSQFGLYPHGLYENPNRRDQIDSGRTSARFEYVDYLLVDFANGQSSLDQFTVGP